MSKSLIVAEEICQSFQKGKESVDILTNISFSVHAGEFVSIMGPSGCGKSTLLYILGGLDAPSQGKVLINDIDIHQLNDPKKSKMRRKDIGFIFQFYNLIPNLTVEENILLPVLMDGQKAKAYSNELDELLHIVGLEERRKYKPNELSGGQQQRVAIARALIHTPALILADEPIGNLDSKSGTEVMELFKQINKERGVTIVQVTHSRESALYGEKVIHLLDGQIEHEESLVVPV